MHWSSSSHSYCGSVWQFSVCTQHIHTQTHRAARAVVGVTWTPSVGSLSVNPVFEACIFQIRIFSTRLWREDTDKYTRGQIRCALMKGQSSLWVLFGSRDEGEDGEGDVNAMATDQGIFNRASGCCIKGRLLWECQRHTHTKDFFR